MMMPPKNNDHTMLTDREKQRIITRSEKEPVHQRASDMKREDAHDHDHGHEHPFDLPEILRIGLVAVAAAAVWFRVWEPYPQLSVIGALGLAIGGWPIVKEAFENILERRMTMELSMTIAIVAAAAIAQVTALKNFFAIQPLPPCDGASAAFIGSAMRHPSANSERLKLPRGIPLRLKLNSSESH